MCNSGLAHLDKALLKQFEITGFISGVRRKGGRPPGINSWAAVAGAFTSEGPVLHLNGGPQMIEALGKKLPSASASNGITDLKFTASGGVGKITFSQEFGHDPKFVRGLYKTAFESLALHSGIEAASVPAYDPVRGFVTDGVGSFRVLMLADQDALGHALLPGYVPPGCSHPIMGMVIFGLSFIADLDPGQAGLNHVHTTAPSDEKWIFLPP